MRRVAAERCFGDVGLTQLRMLAKEFGIDVASDCTLLAVLKALLKATLPDLGPNGIIHILAKRLRNKDPWENFLDMEFGLDSEVLDDPIHREWREELEERFTEHEDFSKALDKEMEEHRPKAPKAKRAKKRPRPNFTDACRDVELQHELPEGWRVWGDTYNSRYQLSFGEDRKLSRSWPLYGKPMAAQLCLEHAWKSHIRLGGLPPSWWPAAR